MKSLLSITAIVGLLAIGNFGQHTSPSAEKKIISTDKAPKAIGPYSQAVMVGDMLFVSGQLALDPQTGKFVSDSIEAQTRQVLKNLGAILEAAGMSFSDVVQCGVFLKDLNDFQKMNAVYAEVFKENPPARATVEVARLPRDGKVEIALTAVKSAR
jgi:2-iminobutanoate/2-iminopropanoate deaminase